MQVGTDLLIGYPYKVYLTFVSIGDMNLPGDFKINIKYQKYDPNAAVIDESENDNYIVV